jgi:hypothetical protein
MSLAGSRRAIRYLAEIGSVKEVMLVGTAGLQFWRDRMQAEQLFPFDDTGAAQVSLTGTDLRWLGIRFRELTISIAVSDHEDGHTHDGYFLVHAYNSVAMLAWTERTMFHTPYYHGDILVEAGPPGRMGLRHGQDMLLCAGMSGDAQLIGVTEIWWEGPIYLPRRATQAGGNGHLFYAKLGGPLERYQFVPGADSFTVHPRRHDLIWRCLVDSGFAGREWRIRRNATHAKSRTFRRL